MSIMCLVLKWFRVENSNDKKKSAYIFVEFLPIYLILRDIYCGLTFYMVIIIARRTESVNEGVILIAAVNCSYMNSVNLTPSPSKSKMCAIKTLFLLCGVFVIILAQQATI